MTTCCSDTGPSPQSVTVWRSEIPEHSPRGTERGQKNCALHVPTAHQLGHRATRQNRITDCDATLPIGGVATARSDRKTACFKRLQLFKLIHRLVDTPADAGQDVRRFSTGFNAFPEAVDLAFGADCQSGQLIKYYRNADQPGRYGPPELVGTERRKIFGQIHPWSICTSHVERVNLTTRTLMKRFTRLSLCFSKKLENLAAAVAISVAYYNFCWMHGKFERHASDGRESRQPSVVDRGTLRKGHGDGRGVEPEATNPAGEIWRGFSFFRHIPIALRGMIEGWALSKSFC